ncbi:hemicentin-1-like [Leptidea sinapis]|uniref:hemicentin-1-like n=1 Tax=Leptidea sinapis TaxID=189913 RepID=UPI0021C4BCEF|nr:hemicentin-1-like [Leptidea sinapis]
MKEIRLSLSCDKASIIQVTDNNGDVVLTKPMISINSVNIVAMDGRDSGKYTAEISCETEASLDVTYSSQLDFKYGFAITKPQYFNENKTPVYIDNKYYLSVELPDKYDDTIILTSADILNTNGEVVTNTTLQLKKEDNIFYVSEAIKIPNDVFKIQVRGYVLISKENIEMLSSTYIKPKMLPATTTAITTTTDITSTTDITTASITSTTASITTDISTTVPETTPPIVELKIIPQSESNNLKIICQVEGYPKPKITWLDQSEIELNGTEISNSTTSRYESVIEIEDNKSNNFTCTASNSVGKDAKFVNSPKILNITEDFISESEVNLVCIVQKSVPESKINWYLVEDYSIQFIKSKENEPDVIEVGEEESGVYICRASNDIGVDIFVKNFIFPYAPFFEDIVYSNKIACELDKLISLDCIAYAMPLPTVHWYFNETELIENSEFHFDDDSHNTLSFVGHLANIGNYTCKSSNYLGSASRSFQLYVPVKIVPPVESVIYVKPTEQRISLHCNATGVPKPEIKWIYYEGKASKIKAALRNTSSEITLSMMARDMKEGLYVCEANNFASSDNFTYTVGFQGPPWIVKHKFAIFLAVSGDRFLRLPCNAYGEPNVETFWFDGNGFGIVLGEYYFKQGHDLIITDISPRSVGTYICTAVNSFGNASLVCTVIVLDTMLSGGMPLDERIIGSEIIYILKNQTTEIDCKLPLSLTDYVRWFKNYIPIQQNEQFNHKLKLKGQSSDDGIYICRVSNHNGSMNYKIDVRIGNKPKFTSNTETEIEFDDVRDTYLDCDAKGIPTPKIVWYMNNTQQDINFQVVYGEGNYTCVLVN